MSHLATACPVIFCGALALLGLSNPVNGAVVLSADFEGSSSLPGGWSQNQLVGSVSWNVQTGSGDPGTGTGTGFPGTAHGGVNNVTFYNSAAGSTTQLLTPVFDSSSFVNLSLTFWHTQREWSGDQDVLKVLFSDDGGSNWVQLAQYTTSIASCTASSAAA